MLILDWLDELRDRGLKGQLDLPAGGVTPDSPAEDLARVKPCAKGKKIVMSNRPKGWVP